MANSGLIWRNGQWVKVSKASTRTHKVGVDPHKVNGGKRKGRNLKVEATTERSGNIDSMHLDTLLDVERVLDIDPLAKVHTVARGTRVKMVTWIDPSRKTK